MSVPSDDTPRAIGRSEECSLRLVFGGPVSLWVPLARLVGVTVDLQPSVDEELLARAEAGAELAGRRFGPGLLATTIATVGLFFWMPLQNRMLEPVMHSGFHTIAGGVLAGGAPFWVAIVVAGATLLVIGLVAGLANAAVFGGVPLVLLRRCTVAAAPAVSVAMAQGDEATRGAQAERYPRVAYAAERILYPRGRK
mgnify:CR=1 FL=1